MSWKVTVRHGSDVSREKLESLDEALAEARARIDEVRREGGLPDISAFRDYRPGERVHARIEVSGPGLLRGAEGGVDVMGDGGVVAYLGSIRKRPIEADSLEDAIEQLGESLSA